MAVGAVPRVEELFGLVCRHLLGMERWKRSEDKTQQREREPLAEN
jgi:hypothetical protein